jgi:hypothetical protein
MIDTWINLWECVIPKRPFDMPLCAYMHVNITHTYTKNILLVRNVVPTLTSMSAEIYLSMAGAKQHDDTDFI